MTTDETFVVTGSLSHQTSKSSGTVFFDNPMDGPGVGRAWLSFDELMHRKHVAEFGFHAMLLRAIWDRQWPFIAIE